MHGPLTHSVALDGEVVEAMPVVQLQAAARQRGHHKPQAHDHAVGGEAPGLLILHLWATGGRPDAELGLGGRTWAGREGGHRQGPSGSHLAVEADEEEAHGEEQHSLPERVVVVLEHEDWRRCSV